MLCSLLWMISKSKVYKELIQAPSLFYLVWCFAMLQDIINFCQSGRRQVKCCNPHRFYKSRGFPFLYWETVFCKEQLHCSLSMLGTPFLSVKKIATKVIKEQIFRRKTVISCVQFGGAGRVKFKAFENNSDITAKRVYWGTWIKSFDILFSFTFFCWLQLKITCEQVLCFWSFTINSLSLSQKGWEDSVLASKVAEAKLSSSKAEPPWLDQELSSSSTAIRNFCMSWVICWLLQRDKSVPLAKRSTTQTKPFFCFSQSFIHRFVASGSFFLCLVIPAGFPTLTIGRPRLVFIVAWQTLNFKRKES